MSTHATIGYETSGGGYVGVYCHFDGYPTHILPQLEKMTYFDVSAEVERGLIEGGIRCLRRYEAETYNDLRRETSNRSSWLNTNWEYKDAQYMYRKNIDGTVDVK